MAAPLRRKAPKKLTNVSVDRDLLKRARELDVNVSAVLKEALEKTVNQKQRQQWLAENRVGIEQYNDLVEAHGVFRDDERGF